MTKYALKTPYLRVKYLLTMKPMAKYGHKTPYLAKNSLLKT
jgi:hypothetical protein